MVQGRCDVMMEGPVVQVRCDVKEAKVADGLTEAVCDSKK